MNPDTLTALRRICVDVETMRRAAHDAARPDARYTGQDPSGTVSVVIDGRRRVTEVDVDPRWERRLARTELSDALMSALGDATTRMMTDEADAIDEAEARAELQRDEIEADLDARFAEPPREYQDEDVISRVQRKLERIEMQEQYGETVTVAARQEDDERTVSGPGGFVDVTIRSGEVVGLYLWASRIPDMATNGTIEQEALGAFRAAQSRY